MAKNKGYILLQRSLLDHWIWNSNETFTDRDAWIDLLLRVNHADNTMRLGKNQVIVGRGQTYVSFRKLAERWKWSKDRVRRYLRRLEQADMVTLMSTPSATLVTLKNYDKLQSRRDSKRDTIDDTNKDTDDDTNGYKTINEVQLMNTKNEYKEPAAQRSSSGRNWE